MVLSTLEQMPPASCSSYSMSEEGRNKVRMVWAATTATGGRAQTKWKAKGILPLLCFSSLTMREAGKRKSLTSFWGMQRNVTVNEVKGKEGRKERGREGEKKRGKEKEGKRERERERETERERERERERAKQ